MKTLVATLREMPSSLNDALRLMETAATHLQDMADALCQWEYAENWGEADELENARISRGYALMNYAAFGHAPPPPGDGQERPSPPQPARRGVLHAEFERGKELGKAIGWQQAKEDSEKTLTALANVRAST